MRNALLVCFLLFASIAQAAARLVVVPVVVGASPEPTPELMAALAKGLQDSGPWTVVHGNGLKALLDTAPGLAAETRKAIADKLAEARGSAGVAEAVVKQIDDLARVEPFAAADFDLLYRAHGALVTALLAASETDRAKEAAANTAALFPGRKPASEDELPGPAAELLSSAPPGQAKLLVDTRPEHCQVHLNGLPVGAAPVELVVRPGLPYQASAVCPGDLQIQPRRITVGEKEVTRQELLDGDFERALRAEGGLRIRFASSPERRQLEERYARRIAERYRSDVVVLASMGELSGADWLNARLYLRSGYLNRQGLVRLEVARASALGRYLATGKEMPGVLRPEEAGALVAAAQAAPAEPEFRPWYTDVVGWCLTGVGLAGLSFGLYENGLANRTSDKADAIRGDSSQQQALQRQAQRQRFVADIGLVGGGLMTVTGIVLLAIPEYTNQHGQLFAVTPVPGGGFVRLGGRF